MNIFMYANQLLQEVTTGAYFCDISNSTKFFSERSLEKSPPTMALTSIGTIFSKREFWHYLLC